MRDLKSQIQRDASRVFLNLKDFSIMAHILYFEEGESKPPRDLEIPVAISNTGNVGVTWNKNQSSITYKHETEIVEMQVVLYCARADFGEAPRKNRFLYLDGIRYTVLTVKPEGGLFCITLRNMEE